MSSENRRKAKHRFTKVAAIPGHRSPVAGHQRRPVIVVEDDPFPRLIQVILDPAAPAERVAAFSHFFAHEEPDFTGWRERLRKKLKRIYPAEVRLVSDESSLLAAMPGASVVVTE